MFLRNTPLKPTYAGERFYQYALEMKHLYDLATLEFQDISHEEQGIIKVGIAHTRGRTIMPEIIRAYRKLYPKMTVQLVEMENDQMPRALMNGEVDLFIAYYTKHYPEIEIMPYYKEKIIITVSEDLLDELYGLQKLEILRQIEEEQNIRPLIKCPLLSGSDDDIVGKFAHLFLEDMHHQFFTGTESNNIETLIELCVLDQGFCFVPEIQADRVLREFPEKKMHKIYLDERAEYEISFGLMKNQYHTKAVLSFVETARSVYGDDTI